MATLHVLTAEEHRELHRLHALAFERRYGARPFEGVADADWPFTPEAGRRPDGADQPVIVQDQGAEV